MLTPPAHVRVTHDRFSIARVTITNLRVEALKRFPASPVEGAWIETYRPGLYGSAQAHLRWATPEALEYEIGVTVPRQPSSETSCAGGGMRKNAAGLKVLLGSPGGPEWAAMKNPN